MDRLQKAPGRVLEDWSRAFPPAWVTVCDLRTGEQLREPSLVAAKVKAAERSGEAPWADGNVPLTCTVVEGYLAAGAAAREYKGTADTAVFSPFRDGQAAHFEAAVYLFKSLIKRLHPGLLRWKPALAVRVQDQTTEVEERAMIDLGILAGAKKVFLYQQPLPCWMPPPASTVCAMESRSTSSRRDKGKKRQFYGTGAGISSDHAARRVAVAGGMEERERPWMPAKTI